MEHAQADAAESVGLGSLQSPWERVDTFGVILPFTDSTPNLIEATALAPLKRGIVDASSLRSGVRFPAKKCDLSVRAKR